MKRQISSKDTFFYKIILPVFFLICAAVLPSVIYFDSENSFAPFLPTGVYSGDQDYHFVGAVYVFAVMMIFLIISFMMSKKLKKLSIADNFLYVSNYWQEIAVPLSNVEKILWLGDARPTLIYLKMPCEFGKKINFYPNVKAISEKSNPIVEELKKLANLTK